MIVPSFFTEIDDKYMYVFKTLSGGDFYDANCIETEKSLSSVNVFW